MRRAIFTLLIVSIITITSGQQNTISTKPTDTIAFGPNGNLIASGNRDNLVQIWDNTTNELHGYFAGHTSWVTQIAFHPTDNIIASGSRDSTVRLWDISNRSELQTLTHHTGAVSGLAFSDDGLLLASGSTDGTIWIGDAATGNQLALLTNYSGPVWSVAFSPDGGSIVSGSEDGTIWWWGLYDNSLTRLDGHISPVTALRFSPDRSILVSSSWDNTIHVWNTTSGELIHTLVGHQGPVTDLVFDESGDLLISSALDGTAFVWDTETFYHIDTFTAESPISNIDYYQDVLVTSGIEGQIDLWKVDEKSFVYPTPTPIPTNPPIIVQATKPPHQATTQPEQPIIIEATAPPQTSGPTISIPTVNIFAGITTFPLDGVSWAIDPWEHKVGHFQGTSWITSAGNVALGGHSEYPDGSRGIFNGLYGVQIGDPIIVNANGLEKRYIVSDKFSVHYTDLSVVYPTTTSRLTLITCDIPTYNPNSNTYDQRLVVIAVPG